MLKLLKYALYDILKSRFAIIYTVFLVLVAVSIYQVSDDLSKVSLSLMNILIMIVPLISAVFATTHFYNNLEFIELMLAQPVKRSQVFLSQLFAVILMLSLSIVVGFGVPMLLWGADSSLITLLAVGVILSAVFTGFAFLASVITRDKAKAIGISLALWIYFSLVYDGLDISALMGYTGAFFQQFFSSGLGVLVSAGALVIWMFWPSLIASSVFGKRDF